MYNIYLACVHIKNNKKNMEGIYTKKLGIFPLRFMCCFATASKHLFDC